MGRLIGIGGFHALLSRALALASAEVPALRALQPGAEFSSEGFKELEAKLDSLTIDQGQLVLLTQLVGLLDDFHRSVINSAAAAEYLAKIGRTRFHKGPVPCGSGRYS